MPVKCRIEKQKHEEDSVEQGEDAQGTPDVEVTGLVLIVPGIVEDSGDEESGKNKEDVDPSPAPRKLEVVLKEDQKECDCAKAIQCGVEDPILRLREFGVSGDGRWRRWHDWCDSAPFLQPNYPTSLADKAFLL